MQYFFIRILPEIAKIYVAKRSDFLESRKNYYRKKLKNKQICKINIAKIIYNSLEKIKKKKKEMGKNFLITNPLSFRVKIHTRVHQRNVLNKSQIKSHIKSCSLNLKYTKANSLCKCIGCINSKWKITRDNFGLRTKIWRAYQ